MAWLEKEKTPNKENEKQACKSPSANDSSLRRSFGTVRWEREKSFLARCGFENEEQGSVRSNKVLS